VPNVCDLLVYTEEAGELPTDLLQRNASTSSELGEAHQSGQLEAYKLLDEDAHVLKAGLLGELEELLWEQQEFGESRLRGGNR